MNSHLNYPDSFQLPTSMENNKMTGHLIPYMYSQISQSDTYLQTYNISITNHNWAY